MRLRLLNWFNQNDHWFRLMLFIVSAVPAALLLLDYYRDQLGFNPFDSLITRTGYWSMVFLLLTLAITPLRRWLGFLCRMMKWLYGKRLADWNFLIKSRRMLGLYSFFYLSWHAGVYLQLELDWNVQWLWEDLQERPFLIAGLSGWLVSLLLALTSPQWARRKLGRRWRQLHRTMYLLTVLAITHLMLEAKVGEVSALLFSAIALILLLHRILVHVVERWRRADDTGLEANR